MPRKDVAGPDCARLANSTGKCAPGAAAPRTPAADAVGGAERISSLGARNLLAQLCAVVYSPLGCVG